MAMRHTPAPWSYEVTGLGYIIKGMVHGFVARIATVHGMGNLDALLITQAPNLFENLKRARAAIAANVESARELDLLEAIDDTIHRCEHNTPRKPKE